VDRDRDDHSVRPSLVPAGEVDADGPAGDARAARRLAPDLVVAASGGVLGVVWALPAVVAAGTPELPSPSLLAFSAFGLAAALRATGRLARLAPGRGSALAFYALWAAAVVVAGAHLRHRHLVGSANRLDGDVAGVLPLVAGLVAFAHFGVVSFLPRFDALRREGRLVWSGAAVVALVALSLVAPRAAAADPTLALLAAVSLPVAVSWLWQVAQSRRHRERGRGRGQDARPGVSLAQVILPALVVCGAGAALAASPAAHPVAALAAAAAAALFLGGALLEGSALDRPPDRPRRRPLVTVRSVTARPPDLARNHDGP
jgi:hypothetical protein